MKNTIIKYRKFISILLLGVYIFAVLLSGYFHKHNSGFINGDSGYRTIPNSSKTSVAGGAENCYTLHTFQVLIGDFHQIENFRIYHPIFYKEYTTAVYFFSSKEEIRFFSLRAPPFFI